jgi:hypothetical protein
MSEKIKAVLDELKHELKHIQLDDELPTAKDLLRAGLDLSGGLSFDEFIKKTHPNMDCDPEGLCETCILERMCERWRRVQDACLDPIIPGRAVVVECEAYRQETQVEEVCR